MKIADATKVRLLDAGVSDGAVRSGAEIWTGTLAEFEAANEFDDATCALVRTELHQRGRWISGGGAAGLFVLEVVVEAGWIVTAIGGRQMRPRIERFQSRVDAEGSAIALLLAGHGVTVLGPDGEYKALTASILIQPAVAALSV